MPKPKTIKLTKQAVTHRSHDDIITSRDADFNTAYHAACAAYNTFPKSTCAASLSGQLYLTNTLRQMVRSIAALARWSHVDPTHRDAISALQAHLEDIRNYLDRD